jgi:hypothetical protein
MPQWVFAREKRSVKIIRTSPGFWKRASCKAYKPSVNSCGLPIWVPIGFSCSRAASTIQFIDTDTGFRTSVQCDFYELVQTLNRNHWLDTDLESGHLIANLPFDVVDGFPAAQAAGDTSFHLIDDPNRASYTESLMGHYES